MAVVPRLLVLLALLVASDCHGPQIEGGGALAYADAVVTPVTSAVQLGEGPHWAEEEQALYFVDIKSRTVNRFIPSTGKHTAAIVDAASSSVDFLVPVLGKSGTFLVAVDRTIRKVNWDGEDGTLTVVGGPLVSVDEDKQGNRFNDGKADPAGRLWGGTMGPEPEVGHVVPAQGTLFSFEEGRGESLTARARLTGVDISNGLAWTADNVTMYYIDTGSNRVDVLDYNVMTGEIGERRPAFDLSEHGVAGHPDGMTIDREGNLWVACFDGSQVIHVDPSNGRLLGSVAIPAQRVTSVAFGGSRLDTLYVTTSRFGLTPEQLAKQPDAGRLFAVTGLGVEGLPGQRVGLHSM